MNIFHITICHTIYKWIRRRDKTSSISPINGYHKGHSHKIKDVDEFIKFIEANPNKTIAV